MGWMEKLGLRRSPSEAIATAQAVAARTEDPAAAQQLIAQGNQLEDSGQPAAAEIIYRQAIDLAPSLARAHLNLGNARMAQADAGGAIAAYRKALALQPDYLGAHVNLGNALFQTRNLHDALAAYDAALALDPRFVNALIGRANTLDDLGRATEASAAYRRALELRPGDADVLSNLGLLLHRAKRYREAAECFEQALVRQPGRPWTRGNLCSARLYGCDWRHYDDDLRDLHAAVAAGRREVNAFSFVIIGQSAPAQLRASQLYAQDRFPPAGRPLWQGEVYDHARIRVAYVSADFHSHATAALMAGLFEAHDRSRFEFYGASFGPDDGSPMRQRLIAAFDHFVDLRQHSDLAIAEQLRAWEIDIAVDLKGYTAQARPGIFTHRPAPIQVNYLGFPGTMGSPWIDYLIADRQVVPPEHLAHTSEQVVWLPGSYQVNDHLRRIADRTPGRAELGLPDDAFVYCCFNNNYKITPAVFDVWMRLLSAAAGSVLWLLEDNPEAVANLRRKAQARGVHPDRLVFAPRMALPEHLARHACADLFLDTLPCNAHTTASDALWAGLPVLTCPGDTFAARVASSLVLAAGLPELVAPSMADYEAIALQLAQDRARLDALRSKLAEQRLSCALFDTDAFRRHLESAFETMWRRQQDGLPPAHFSVDG